MLPLRVVPPTRDEVLASHIVCLWRTKNYDAIKVRCYNKAEAELLKRMVMKMDPAVRLQMTFLEFR